SPRSNSPWASPTRGGRLGAAPRVYPLPTAGRQRTASPPAVRRPRAATRHPFRPHRTRCHMSALTATKPRGDRRRLGTDRRHNLTGWGFLLPAAVLIVLISFVPMIQALILSLQTGRGTRLDWADPLWYNYQRLLGDEIFKQTLGNTLIYLLIQAPIMLLLALALADLLGSPRLRGRAFWRTAISLPCAMSLVAYSLVFRTMFATDGFVNDFLGAFGVEPVNWLGDPATARAVII